MTMATATTTATATTVAVTEATRLDDEGVTTITTTSSIYKSN